MRKHRKKCSRVKKKTRMATSKTRNAGQWTEARYRGFIRSALRAAWMKWPPNQQAKRDARVERGIYRCAGYQCKPHLVPASVVIDGKRKNNVFTDHIKPIGGHESWDKIIAGMFCESNNLQVLCNECHKKKTLDERAAAREAKKSV